MQTCTYYEKITYDSFLCMFSLYQVTTITQFKIQKLTYFGYMYAVAVYILNFYRFLGLLCDHKQKIIVKYSICIHIRIVYVVWGSIYGKHFDALVSGTTFICYVITESNDRRRSVESGFVEAVKRYRFKDFPITENLPR